MDAITYLKNEHNKFRRTLVAIGKLSNEKLRKNRFNAFCEDLMRHEIVEQRVWYPVLKKYPELRHIIKHLLGEEKSAAKAIKAFQKSQYEFMWTLRFYKFRHDVNHHAKEEEQGLFPKVRKVLTKAELNQLGAKMRKYKATLK